MLIETNKINLELLNVKTEASLNETALRNKHSGTDCTERKHTGRVSKNADYPAVPSLPTTEDTEN